MKLLFAGTPQAAVPALQALLASDHDVVGVLTRPDARAGRGRRSAQPQYSPVKQVALRAGLPVLQPARLDDAAQAEIAGLAPDCCPVVAYGNLLPAAALAVPPLGWVNLHFSLLPAWRGAAPVQHAVINGDDITGATVFVVEEDMDTGPVLSTLSEPVQPAQTAGELLDRLAQAGADLLLSTLDGLAAGALTPVPQPADGVSYAPKISTADARVRWSHPAQSVDRRIRGCTPAPGAWTGWHDERLKIGPVSLEPAAPALSSGPAPAPDEALAPGELSVTKAGVLVGTATTAVRLGQVQPAGKKPMPATDWARGARVQPGDRFADGTGLGTQAGP